MLAVRLIIELSRSSDGRIEGEVTADTGEPALAFSGFLELLRALEDLGPGRAEPRDDPGGAEREASVDPQPRSTSRGG
jgi:hypothetical protein